VFGLFLRLAILEKKHRNCIVGHFEELLEAKVEMTKTNLRVGLYQPFWDHHM
jgi:hypothetical protein